MANLATVIHIKVPGEVLDLADELTELLAGDLSHKNQGEITRAYTIRHALLRGLQEVIQEYKAAK